MTSYYIDIQYLGIHKWNSQYEKVETREDIKHIYQWPDNLCYYKNYRTVQFGDLIRKVFTGPRLEAWCE